MLPRVVVGDGAQRPVRDVGEVQHEVLDVLAVARDRAQYRDVRNIRLPQIEPLQLLIVLVVLQNQLQVLLLQEKSVLLENLVDRRPVLVVVVDHVLDDLDNVLLAHVVALFVNCGEVGLEELVELFELLDSGGGCEFFVVADVGVIGF